MTHHSNRTISRRQFAATTALAALSAAIVPSRVLGAQAPSNKLNIAAIGIGGMGAANLKACEGENIVALCDVDRDYAAKTIALYPKATRVHRLPRDAREGEGHRRGHHRDAGPHARHRSRWPRCRPASTCYCQKPLTHTVVRGAHDRRGGPPVQGRDADGQPGALLRVDAAAEGVARRRGDRQRHRGPRVDGPAGRRRPVVRLRGAGAADRHAAGARDARLGEVARAGRVPARTTPPITR